MPTTHEPETPLPNWPDSHVQVLMTDATASECIKLTIHGVDHFLHSTTAAELQRMLQQQLAAYNKQVKQLNRQFGLQIPTV